MLYPKLRKPARPKRRAYIGERVVSIGELRSYVIRRDGGCVLIRLDPRHRCRGKFDSVPYHDRDYTLEHVVGVHGPTDVRRDDDAHTVGLCYGTNIDHTGVIERRLIRDHLTALFPECLPSSRGGDG